ncbi:MAG: hypothetical protein FWE61_09110, partial [Micrococcales bacterium]|nr:hypothetical protein [Micrococcales bacterium]
MRRLVAGAVAVAVSALVVACQTDSTGSPTTTVTSPSPTVPDTPQTPGLGEVHRFSGVLQDPLMGHRVLADQWVVWTPEPVWVAEHPGFDGATVVLVHVTAEKVTGTYSPGVYPTSFRLAAHTQDVDTDILAGDVGTVVHDQLPDSFVLYPATGAGRDRTATGWLVFNVRGDKQQAPYTLVLRRAESLVLGSDDEI